MKTTTSDMDTATMDTTRTMKKGFNLGLVAFVAASIMLCGYEAWAGATQARNPPECDKNSEDCGCDSGEEVTPACIKVNLALGETTPWTRSMSCALKIFADSDSPNVFSQDSLYAVLGGYTFKRLGTKNLSDGVTPAEVVLAHPQGEPVHFVFKDGESMALPDPGVHIKMDERLQMVDAEGWATTHDPVYYDLYVGDGSRRRFLATDMTGALGSLVSVTDARGVTVTPADMGVDIIYDANGVRQFLTPSRLADVIPLQGFKGFEVKVYALQAAPQKNAATGLYVPPQATPVKHLRVRPENGWRRAIVTLKGGSGEPKTYVFDYALGDWSMTRSSGVEERKEREVADGRAAYIKNETIAADGTLLSRKVKNYSYESWGFAMTNRVEGFDGVANVTEWTYYTSGNGKGQVKTEKRQSGLLIQYAYDSVDRVISETRSGPGMMTETTAYDYTPVDASDPVLPVDTRPRTVVKTLDGIECERTYCVYSPLTNIVERVGTQGAAFGGTNVLRTVTAFYPIVANDLRSGRVASIRHEDGKLDVYDYSLVSNLWVETVTHLHEQSPSPVSGKTTRDITLTNARGEVSETRTEAFIDGIWHTIARNRMTYNAEGKRTSLENLAGQITTTAWDCCHKVSETQPDGSTTTWDYDDEGRVIAASRLIPLDMTNVTWLTTCYKYDALGRQVAAWQTNYAAQVGLPVTSTRYDQLGRVIARVDQIGNTTTTEYSPDGRTVSVRNPNTSTRVTTRSADGFALSVTGTAATPEFRSRGVLPDGTRWTRVAYGESADSPRFEVRHEDALGRTVRVERGGFGGATLATVYDYDGFGRLVRVAADGEPAVMYAYGAAGERVSATRSVGAEWRKTETDSRYALVDGEVWRVTTNAVSCSDAAVPPLVTSSAVRLTGLTAANPSRRISTDARGNATEEWTAFADGTLSEFRRVPGASNAAETRLRFGAEVLSVSASSVTNATAYDALGRIAATADGRGNVSRTGYNQMGLKSYEENEFSDKVRIEYDLFGREISLVDSKDNRIECEYDVRGNRNFEYGAVYPTRYKYDIYGNRVATIAYRFDPFDPQESKDVVTTTWNYDHGTGVVLDKCNDEGRCISYKYDRNGRLIRRIWARGVKTDYSYDGWGNLTNVLYSDGTPSIITKYDALGRKISIEDGIGLTSFLRDRFGSITNEVIQLVDGERNVINREYDKYGRICCYYIWDGVRKWNRVSFLYEAASGRLRQMKIDDVDGSFDWSYLGCSDLIDEIHYPNGVYVKRKYQGKERLVAVKNLFAEKVISQYSYSYDSTGSKVYTESITGTNQVREVISYNYNERRELCSAVLSGIEFQKYECLYDNQGNRLHFQSEEGSVAYNANQLNQYTQIVSTEGENGDEAFNPKYDEDGNQTYVRTSTGHWKISYNGENRPILWTCGSTNIVVQYDYLGRCAAKIINTGIGDVQKISFIYDGFRCIRRYDDESEELFIWDPCNPIKSKPLMMMSGNGNKYYYVHDGDGNVSDLITSSGNVKDHYRYSPFGVLLSPESDKTEKRNPYRFASEYSEDLLGVINYAYRDYNPLDGRWLSEDSYLPLENQNLYLYVMNNPVCYTDAYGLFPIGLKESDDNFNFEQSVTIDAGIGEFSFSYSHNVTRKKEKVKCKDCREGLNEEWIISDVGGGGGEWSIPPNSILQVRVGFSYQMGGETHRKFDFCTGQTTETGCQTLSFQVSGAACVNIGIARWCLRANLRHEGTKCGSQPASSKGSGSIEFSQCFNYPWPWKGFSSCQTKTLYDIVVHY